MSKRTIVVALLLMALIRGFRKLSSAEGMTIRPFVGIALLGIMLAALAEVNESLAGRFAVLILIVVAIATFGTMPSGQLRAAVEGGRT